MKLTPRHVPRYGGTYYHAADIQKFVFGMSKKAKAARKAQRRYRKAQKRYNSFF